MAKRPTKKMQNTSLLAVLPWLVLVGFTTSCASTSTVANADAGSTAVMEEPVASTPLAGTVGSLPFTGRHAVVHLSSPHPPDLTVYGEPTPCNADPRPSLLVGLAAWSVGTHVVRSPTPGELQRGAKDDDFVTVNFVHDQASGIPANDFSDSGRLEVLEAPTVVGTKGKMRLRASAGAGNAVQGEISVEVCD
jgi:hypothetical protein